jgi:hypothetical protein
MITRNPPLKNSKNPPIPFKENLALLQQGLNLNFPNKIYNMKVGKKCPQIFPLIKSDLKQFIH